jgi:hypothetical protein
MGNWQATALLADPSWQRDLVLVPCQRVGLLMVIVFVCLCGRRFCLERTVVRKRSVQETVDEDEGKMITEDQVAIYIDIGASRSVPACSRSVSACIVFGMSRTQEHSHFCPHCRPIKAVSLLTKTEAGIFNNEMALPIQCFVEHVLEERFFQRRRALLTKRAPFKEREPLQRNRSLRRKRALSKKESSFKERKPFHRIKPFLKQKELSKKPSRVCV